MKFVGEPKMKKKLSKFFVLSLLLGATLVGHQAHASTKAVRIGTAICVNKNGRAQYRPDLDAIRSQTARVVVNSWINHGPWAPCLGFGVIIPQ